MGGEPTERSPDVQREEAAPAGSPRRRLPGEVIPLSGMRKMIAANLTKAWREIPHVTDMRLFDIQNMVERRRAAGKKVGHLSILAKAAATALAGPGKRLNGIFDAETSEVVVPDDVNIGIAVATDRGLVVPVLRRAQALTLPALDTKLAAMAEAARAGHLRPRDYKGGSFTISNGGSYGAEFGTPIIRQPEIAILVLGAIRIRPWIDDGQVTARWTLPVTIGADHRIVDGIDIGAFLSAFEEAIHVETAKL